MTATNDKIVIKPGSGYIDSLLAEVSLQTVPIWKSMNLTPNWLTTFGLICSLICLWLTYMIMFQKKGIKIGALAVFFLILRIYFDSADGIMARQYDMQSEIGGWYDHIVDWLFILGFTGLIAIYDWRFLMILVPLYVTSALNIGCMERRYEKDSGNKGDNSLSVVNELCELDSTGEEVFKVLDNICLYSVMIIIMIYISKNN